MKVGSSSSAQRMPALARIVSACGVWFTRGRIERGAVCVGVRVFDEGLRLARREVHTDQRSLISSARIADEEVASCRIQVPLSNEVAFDEAAIGRLKLAAEEVAWLFGCGYP